MSELSERITREAIANHAASVRKHSFTRADYPGRERSRDAEVTRPMLDACRRSDEFERTSLELMYAEHGGDPADLPAARR
jgi:hypothetical protein